MTLNSRELDNDKDDDGEPHVCVVAAAQATEMKALLRQRGKRATTTTTTSATQHAVAICEHRTEIDP